MTLELTDGRAAGEAHRPLPLRSACIEARDVWFSYDGRAHVLRGVNLVVAGGAMTMILGRSGSGKTTLLKLFRGLLRPGQGEITLHKWSSDGTQARPEVAYIPQTLGLVRSMTALDNTLTGGLVRTGTVRSLFRSFRRELVDEAKETIASLGLAHKFHQPVQTLSGGERQRVAIARALMQKPSLILADEFVSQLDPLTAEETLDMMRDIAGQGVSLLITTHETDIVAGYADHVVVMAEGRVVHEDTGGSLSEREMRELLR